MAATNSTDTTLKADFLIPLSTLLSLMDSAEFTGDESVGFHTSVWSEVKRDLKKRAPPLEESDLNDSSELQHAAHLLCLRRLFGMSGLERDVIESSKWLAAYRKEMREVNLSTPSEQPASASETTLVRS